MHGKQSSKINVCPKAAYYSPVALPIASRGSHLFKVTQILHINAGIQSYRSADDISESTDYLCVFFFFALNEQPNRNRHGLCNNANKVSLKAFILYEWCAPFSF